MTNAAAPVGKGRIFAWGLWDWGSSAFNAVIITFVFGPYLVKSVGADLGDSAGARYGWVIGIAGFLIAVLAPVTGQRADSGGHRKRSLAIYSALVTVSIVSLVLVKDNSSWFLFGAAMIGLGSVFFEIGAVFYNAMLRQISTPATIGRVSGFGWSMGYFGGIVLLLICYFGFISGEDGAATAGFLGVSTANGFNFSMVAVLAAVWFGAFAIPVFFAVPEVPPGPKKERVSFLTAYRVLFADIAALFRADRKVALFLLASAIFRDGLAGVFHFGAILAVTVYGFSSADVLIFGVAANIVSALGAVVAGRYDDRIGPRTVIITSLIGLFVTGLAMMMVSGQGPFWICGLILCLFVGPAQSASRTYMARVSPPGREGQMFGLYATTGRAVSFITPLLWSASIALFGSALAFGGGTEPKDRAGIIGILVVLLVGLILMLRVPRPVDKALTTD